MNLAKCQGIFDLLAKLDLSERGWTVADHWEADSCAVGIALAEAPRCLVYISTYDMEPGRYNYECEAPSEADPDDYTTTERGENVDFDTLLAVMQRHLRSELGTAGDDEVIREQVIALVEKCPMR